MIQLRDRYLTGTFWLIRTPHYQNINFISIIAAAQTRSCFFRTILLVLQTIINRVVCGMAAVGEFQPMRYDSLVTITGNDESHEKVMNPFTLDTCVRDQGYIVHDRTTEICIIFTSMTIFFNETETPSNFLQFLLIDTIERDIINVQ